MSDVFYNSLLARHPDVLNPERKVNITIIYNQIDHDSLMASILLKDLLTRKYNNRVELRDIRSALPAHHPDLALWMGCGYPEDYYMYYEENSDLWRQIISHTQNGIKPLLKHSIHYQPNHEHPLLALVLLDKLFVMDSHYTREDYHRFWWIASAFHNNGNKAEDIVRYYHALNNAYQLVLGYQRTFIEDILNPVLNSVVTQTDIKSYSEEQCALSEQLNPLLNRVRLGGIEYIYLTIMGNEVYNLIRRLHLSNRCFLHVSTGAYGQIVYSNTSSAKRFLRKKGILYLHT